MNKKYVLSVTLIIVLVGMVFVSPKVQNVEAYEIIYIRASGLVEGTDKIQREGDIYTFIDNVNAPIAVERNNVIIDGKGYTLQGEGMGIGFCLSEITNVTIKNTNIKGFDRGIYLLRASHSVISGNNISSNIHGVYIWWSFNNAFFGNKLSNNALSLHIEGDMQAHFMHSIDTSNLIDDKPIYYLENQEHLLINPTTYPQIGYLALINSTDITVENLTLRDNGQGLMLVNTNNSLISENNIINNEYGIFLFSSFNNSLSENDVTNNYVGIYLKSSPNNTLYNNNFTNNYVNSINLPAPIQGEPATPNEPHDANAMWIEPSIIDLTDLSIGERFNVTVWVNITAACAGWQFCMLYDNNILNATNGGYTAGEKSDFFKNMTTWPNNPYFGIFNTTYNRVMHGESLFPQEPVRNPGYGSLSWIEFEVLTQPSETQKISTAIDISTLHHPPTSRTFVCHPVTNEIPLNVSDAICVLTRTHTPEFPLFLIMPLFMIATLAAVIVYKKRLISHQYKL